MHFTYKLLKASALFLQLYLQLLSTHVLNTGANSGFNNRLYLHPLALPCSLHHRNVRPGRCLQGKPSQSCHILARPHYWMTSTSSGFGKQEIQQHISSFLFQCCYSFRISHLGGRYQMRYQMRRYSLSSQIQLPLINAGIMQFDSFQYVVQPIL